MDAQVAALEPSDARRAALVRAADASRTAVMDATEVGKSSFVVQAMAAYERGDIVIGILEELGPELIVHAPEPPRSPCTIRLGSMWAEPHAGGWTLLERLAPAWRA